ncbi:hypothetical protein FDH43_gp30 [Escherichia phage vB_EcoM_ECOO78]|uniref:Uncharacterized protein n=1 Tax=Escherichia phage vB_EcoM_ECOO78 TaxID=1970797 RepID=A0A1W6JT81_9CAUD|nr:hypothetical protein FDH43_gp30 [Escherichia phage vB_EcoM_ECOO78]ARM70435.1 hypothetical protein vBEcoMECOO78_30 [Escherichia phage vB_EcoM_ECOO78]
MMTNNEFNTLRTRMHTEKVMEKAKLRELFYKDVKALTRSPEFSSGGYASIKAGGDYPYKNQSKTVKLKLRCGYLSAKVIV